MAKVKNNSPDVPNAFKRWPEEDTNKGHIAAIERLAKEMQEHIKKLVHATASEFEAKTEAQDYLHLFQVNQIKACRDMFE